jgi:hypothetical protein
MKKDFLTTKELAERWAMAVGSLENWRQQARGPRYYKMGGSPNSDVRYKIKDVEKFEKEHMVSQQ